MCSSLGVNDPASQYEHVVNGLVGEGSVDFGAVRALALKVARKDRAVGDSTEVDSIGKSNAYYKRLNIDVSVSGAYARFQEIIGVGYRRYWSFPEIAGDETRISLAPNVSYPTGHSV